MKKVSWVLCFLMVFCIGGVANAVPTTWTDNINWNPDLYINGSYNPLNLFDGFGYFHNIADDGFLSTWNGGDDTISSFSLSLRLYDNTEKWYIFESAAIWTPMFNDTYDFSLSSDTFSSTILGYVDLMDDGTLNVYIDPVGDFYADWSKLTVYGDNGAGSGSTAPVPEPATMLLFGTGLIGLAGTCRKKFFQE